MNNVLAERRVILQPPSPRNASAIYQLVTDCKPLEVNTQYLYLLLCTHFRDTCTTALLDGRLVGATTAYLVPERRNTLFIWQIAVASQVRQYGLATRMLQHLLRRSSCRGVRFLEATVSPSNQASLHLFQSFAEKHNVSIRQVPFFPKELFLDPHHEEENLIRIGPLKGGT